MVFLGVSQSDRQKLETEVVPEAARLQLTRLVRGKCKSESAEVEIARINRFINISRTVVGKPIYVLQPDDMGMYEVCEFAWHFAELELAFRRPSSTELAEILADLVQCDLLLLDEVNDVLKDGNVSFSLQAENENEVKINILAVDDIEDEDASSDHPNIRLLINRMEQAYEDKDYSGVLVASASTFETLAKIVFNSSSVENSTLGSIIDGYKSRSKLPEFLLDHIKETYNRRNSEPLAGHGSTLPSTVSHDDATVLLELTKTCVRIERKLSEQDA